MTWDSSLETGDSTVDEEHRTIVMMINEFHDAVRKQKARDLLDGALKRLEDYILRHFSHEEGLMRDSGYPDYKSHQAAHENLSKHANEMIQGFRGGTLGVPVTLSRFLQDWLTLHIMQTDKKFIRYLQERKKRAA